MRVTNRMLYSQLVSDIGASSEKMLKLNTQISSGKRINKPSDDPVGMGSVLNDRTDLSALDQYSSAIDYADGLATETESVLSSVTDLLDRASELATQAASSTASEATRSETAAEIAEIMDEVYSLANTKYNGKYIFGGTQTDSTPFLEIDADKLEDDVLTVSAAPPAGAVSGDRYIDTDDNHIYSYDGTTWTDLGEPDDGTVVQATQDDEIYVYDSTAGWQTQYQGNDATFSVKIGKTDTVEANITGSEVFRSSDGDVFKTLTDLYSALENNDQSAIQESLTEIENANEVISKNTATIGARITRLENRTSAISESETTITEHKSTIEDVDYAEAVTALENQTTIYEACLSAASKITKMSLVDYIS